MSDIRSFLDVAAALADGAPVDWDAAENLATSDADRSLLAELRFLATITHVHPESSAAPVSRTASPGATGGKSLAPPPTGTDEWGPLRILDHIGRGTFGDVYRAWDTRLDREVALKVLRRGPLDDASRATTVIQEGRLLARVRHPNVVTVYGAERINGEVGVWMEFIHGRTLEEELQEHGSFDADYVSKIGVDLASALAAVHQAGLVHRDVKAHNVMHDRDGRLVLTDFGAGCELEETPDEFARELAGTPVCAAPEVLDGRTATPQSDIYSLGVLLYHLATGTYPVRGRSLKEVREAHRLGRRIPLVTARPDLPADFVRIIDRALEPDPGNRYDSAETLGAKFAALRSVTVDGQTLAERVALGPMPLQDVLAVARQVASALEAVHEKGVVHRHLKPSSIQVTRDGLVRLLDFGLARAAVDKAAGGDLVQSAAESEDGLVRGAVTYASPEQARGASVDKRTDIWAFGCVVYEMLTGRPAFRGETIGDALSGVLKMEPDWASLPPHTPPAIRKLLSRCLQQDPTRRLHDIADARIELEEAPGEDAEVPKRRASGRSIWSVVAVTVLVAGATALGFHVGRARDRTVERRVEVNVPPTTAFESFAISPDGRTLVFVATSDGLRRLWLRPLDSVAPQPIRGTDGAHLPFWSPGSQAIGFFADGKLKRIEIRGGSPQTLANAVVAHGGTWNKDGVIVFSPAPGAPLYRVSERGGQATPVTQLVSPQLGHWRPSFLPDGNHFLIYAQTGSEAGGVYLGSLESSDVRRLFAADAPAVFVAPDRILFIQEGTLFARRFDTGTLEPTGEAVPIAQRVAAVSATAAGVIAYRTTSESSPLTQLNWLDRSGRPVTRLGPLQSLSPELSPDGTFVAMHRLVSGNIDVWLVDAETGGAPIRLTTDSVVEGFPIWSPDASRMVFTSDRFELRVKAVNGVGRDVLLWRSTKTVRPSAWSPDGRYILIRLNEPGETNRDIYALPLAANGTPDGIPIPVATSPFDERDGQFSPDGRWVVYQSDESGRFEIYLQPFPGPGPKVPVTANGGIQVRWPRGQFKELFYIALDGKLMTVPVIRSLGGKTIKTGTPAVLFPTSLRAPPNREQLRQEFDLSPDGRRVLMSDVAEWATPITLILNWRPPSN